MHRLLRLVAPLITLRHWQRWSHPPLFLPFYHLVSDENPSHVRHLYPVRTVRQFRDDLDFFLQNYRPVPLSALWDEAENRSAAHTAKPPMHLSFDDGLRECHEVVMPILLEKGVPATFFLNPSFVDNRDLMFRYKASLLREKVWHADEVCHASPPADPLSVTYAQRHLLDEMAASAGIDFAAFLEKQRPYLSTEQIRAMQGRGFTFGAHSMDHPLYRQLPLEEQLSQTLESLRCAHEQFGAAPGVFAFPFTDDGVERVFFKKIHDALGMPLRSFGSAGLKFDTVPSHLQRVPMEKTNLPARSVVPAEYAAFLLKKMLGRHRVPRS